MSGWSSTFRPLPESILQLLTRWYIAQSRVDDEWSYNLRKSARLLDEDWHRQLCAFGLEDEPAPYEDDHRSYGYYDETEEWED